MALATASVSNAAYTPVAIQSSSYNADAIVESNATPVLTIVTTATVDNGTNNTAATWFEAGYDVNNPANGLPAANTVFTAQGNANYTFKMPPTYAGPNGILIDTVVTNGTFTLTTPATYTLLSFIGSGGNGGDVIGVKVNHANGSFETGSFGCPDWINGSGVALTVGGRLQNPVTFTTETDGANPRIYFRDVALTNTVSPVTSIVLTYLSGSASSHNDIIAVSGATTPGGPVAPIAVTGYTYDFVVEASAAKRGRVVSQTIVAGTNVWATTQTMDNENNTGFCFYEKGHDVNAINNGPLIYGNPAVDAIAQASGIPVHGTTFTNGDHSFKMAPDYTVNDVVWLSPAITNATITLTTPTAASALSFLDAAGNGPVQPIVIVHHQDGSSETNTITIVDWFSGSTPMYIPNGRVAADSGQWDQQSVTQNGADRLFASDMPLANVASPVTSIDLVYTNTGGRCGIFALSATAGAVPPIFTQQPTGTNNMAGTDVQMGVQVTGTAPITFQWQKGTNGIFANLSNGGNVSGATTANLTILAANYFSDAADYRVVAANAGGSATSAVATVILYSTNVDVTQPGDPVTSFGTSLFGDGPPANVIDNNLGTKFGANVNGPCGLVISPSVGATLVTGLRFFTANDSTGRDPADYKLEGSINGGSTYSLIASNSVTLPDARNNAGTTDPLVAAAKEVSFNNANGYTTYRLTFSHYKGGAGQTSCQLGDVELLGVTTNLVINVVTPPTAKATAGTTLTVNATVTGSPTPNSRWQKQVAGVFTDLTDGGTVSGSHTASLTINPAALADTGLLRLIATNSLASVTSAVVQMTIISTNVDVTTPGDTITDFGNTSANATAPNNAFDDSFFTFVTRGSGLNNNAGFPPFGGPVGLVITPAAGNTILQGVRIYPGGDGIQSDPADFKLEGSLNGGASYTTIVPTTALSLPDDRNPVASGMDPLTAAVQEVLFVNTQGYTSYRLTFNHTKDDNSANSLSIGDIELLGVAVPGQPFISSTVFNGGSLSISGSGGTAGGSFTVLTNANLTVPVASWGTATTGAFDGSGNFSISLPVSGSNPRLFYLIKTP
ncbi:MAG: Immunoglobulin I-set domain protein [Pedosphaera sp.]|nr:Immunoglobulin I-set domain protein [Pedosphaera sp.]